MKKNLKAVYQFWIIEFSNVNVKTKKTREEEIHLVSLDHYEDEKRKLTWYKIGKPLKPKLNVIMIYNTNVNSLHRVYFTEHVERKLKKRVDWMQNTTLPYNTLQKTTLFDCTTFCYHKTALTL